MSQTPPSFPSFDGVPPPSSDLQLPSYSSAPPPLFDPRPLFDEVDHPYFQNPFSSIYPSSPSLVTPTHHEHLVVSRWPSMLDPPNPMNSILHHPNRSSSNPQFFETSSCPQTHHYPPNAHQLFSNSHFNFNFNSTPPPAYGGPFTLLPPFDYAPYTVSGGQYVPSHQFMLPPTHYAPNDYPITFSDPLYISHPISHAAPISMTSIVQQPIMSTQLPPNFQSRQITEPLPTPPLEDPPSEWESLVAQVNMLESGHECTVCLEHLLVGELVIQLPCNHFFHRNCIAPWMERSGNCPYCRRQVVNVEPNNNEEDDEDNSSNSTFVTDSDWEFDEELLDELIECWGDADMHLESD